MHSIFITRQIPDIGIKMLKDKGFEVDVNMSANIPSQEEIIAMASRKKYDAVITLLTDRIDSKVLEALPSVKIYSNYAAGFDNIDVTEANKKGIMVANTPSPASSTAVAEHAITLLLALGRRIIEADKFVKDGKYLGWSPLNFLGEGIKERTLGLVGLGRIGKQVAALARALGLKVVYNDTVRCQEIEESSDARFYEHLDDMLPVVDFLSLHVPLMDTTMHLIEEKKLSLMKPTAVIINTSRGPVIDEVALASALEGGRLFGAGLDVFEFEPKVNSKLAAHPNVILTPHIASATIEAREEMSKIVAENLIAFFEGREVTNAINK